VPDPVIAPDDPYAPDVLALLAAHLDLMRRQSPPEDVHALDPSGLAGPAVTFLSARDGARLLGVGALARLDADHAEIKSMHTAHGYRGRGVAAAILDRLLDTARRHGYRRVSLETGAAAAFAPARGLYARAGFAVCGPFAAYRPSPHSTFMTRAV
jgi:putative acetyltransferase